MQNRAIEIFYLFFQGVIIFQALIFFALFIITGKKDILYYSLFLFSATAYFFINAPHTFFGIPEEVVWDSIWYDYVNTPTAIVVNLFYLLFLQAFFSNLTDNAAISRMFRLIIWFITALFVIFVALTFLKFNREFIYYTAKLIDIFPAIIVTNVILKQKPPFARLVAAGLVCNIIGISLTVWMDILFSNSIGHSIFATTYPFFFIRLGILADMVFYLIAILKKWHFQENQLVIEKMQSQQEILKERLRISRELHDDIGSTLGSISVYSEVAKNHAIKKEKSDEAISKIGIASRELIDKMSDIVWSLNPNNESFGELKNRMEVFAAVMLTSHEILYNFYMDEAVKNIHLTAEERKNIYLIYKEAIHNILKYAECTQVEIKVFLNSSSFAMIIKDNGKGFDLIKVQKTLGGNGIKNMQARAAAMNAYINLSSKLGEGTMLEFKLNS